MDTDSTKGIIELGTLFIKCLIVKINSDSTVKVLSTSTTKSEGIHNGTIINLKNATNAIRTAISNAENKTDISLKKINVVIEQPEFLCTKFSKHKRINGSKIKQEDIEFLLKEAKKQVIFNDNRQSIIHIFNHNYIVDGKTFIEEPINVFADYLSHEMTFITMPKNNIKNINQAFIDCDIEVERYISSVFAQGAKILNENELKFGSILIDIGHEKTSLGLFKNFALVHSITFEVGINHITKDISKVCSLSIEESEIIKNRINFSFEDDDVLFDENNFLKKDFFNKTGFRKISKTLINNIIKARLDEIFEVIKKQLITTEIKPDTGSTIFIVGGGSNLKNLNEYCSIFFGKSVRKFDTNNKNEAENKSKRTFDSCLGALKIIKDGWETEAIPEREEKNIEKIGFFSRFFGNRG
tara:strand:- start:7657 stop:8892 length:1236 start_codon:yes stop_codon:yes gene_type:complete